MWRKDREKRSGKFQARLSVATKWACYIRRQMRAFAEQQEILAQQVHLLPNQSGTKRMIEKEAVAQIVRMTGGMFSRWSGCSPK
jgi:polyhydroxyalkanoate synthesis regulator protein